MYVIVVCVVMSNRGGIVGGGGTINAIYFNINLILFYIYFHHYKK